MSDPSAVVHVVDDDPAVRDSVAFLLEASGYRTRAYASAKELLDRDSLEPGCIVTDVRMPELTGMELVQRLKTTGVVYPVIMITGHADVPLAVEAMKAGVADFIEKPFRDDVLIAAVRSALSRAADSAQEQAERAEAIERTQGLSTRERDVLEGLVAGKPNKVIAYDLGISPRTVEVYRASLMTKMQAGSLSELVRLALLAGGS